MEILRKLNFDNLNFQNWSTEFCLRKRDDVAASVLPGSSLTTPPLPYDYLMAYPLKTQNIFSLFFIFRFRPGANFATH